MTDENQDGDRRKGPWLLMLMFVLGIGLVAMGIVIAIAPS
jgi:hypothetical protein